MSVADREVIVCTTMVIALVTIFIKGGLTIKVLELLGIQRGVDPGPYVEKVCDTCVECVGCNEGDPTCLLPLLIDLLSGVA